MNPMRRRGIAALILVCAVAVVSAVLLWGPRHATPRIGFSAMGYSLTNQIAYLEALNDGDRSTPTNPVVRLSTIQPGAGFNYQQVGTVLLAQVRIENTGPFPIVYESQFVTPNYDCLLLKADTTTRCTYYRLSGGYVVLEPGRSVDFLAWLPPDTDRWRVGFSCRRSSWLRALGWRYASRFNSPPRILEELLSILPDDDNPCELWSELIKVPKPIVPVTGRGTSGGAWITSTAP